MGHALEAGGHLQALDNRTGRIELGTQHLDETATTVPLPAHIEKIRPGMFIAREY